MSAGSAGNRCMVRDHYGVIRKQLAGLATLCKTHPPLDARMAKIDGRGYEKLRAYVTRE